MRPNIKSVRLTNDIIPVEYDITLKPDFKNFTFEGFETIFFENKKETKKITLHSKDIDIETVSLLKGEEKIFAEKIYYDQKKDTASFIFKKNITKGKHKINIVFKGILNDKMRGFYSSKYLLNEKEHYLATTQFESTDARRAFPCFDEPSLKAIFHVSLVVPKGKTAISNTLPVKVEEHEAGFEVIRFAPTPIMSTYLLAFVVGDFEFIESYSKRNVQVRVFTTPGKLHQAKFALECAIKTLDFYEKYFDINYPLNTLDMIAIPDFQAGAMENWGAITYRENAILFDEKHSSPQNKQWVALVIAHEIAHQWFGNLVTMEWWTHLWLNEGFASYIEYLAVDKLFPEFDIWTQFSVHDLGIALKLDSLENTHAVEIEVHHPDEIGEIFDEVSYSKGACIIRMLASYLGETNFRDGLRYYLKKHSYKNTETIHLWEAFEKISGKPVKKVMHNWTSKPGHPVIKAEIKNNKLHLSQSRFFASPISKAKSKDKTIWQVPTTLGFPPLLNKEGNEGRFLKGFSSNSPHPSSLLIKERENLLATSEDCLKLNSGENGFFRVAYSEELLEKLTEPVLNKILSPRDRLGIIRDLFALSESGDIKTTEALKFLKAYKNEDDYTVWLEIASGLEKLEQIFYKTKSVKYLNRLTIELFTPIFKKLGWNKEKNERHTDTLLRALCVAKLGQATEKNIVSKTKKEFEKFKKGIHINPDLRNAVYKTISNTGDIKEYEIFVARYKKETMHEEKYRIGNALCNFKNKKILKKTAIFALSKNVRAQDTIYILASLAQNPLGRDVWFEYIRKNWDILISRYGEGGHTLHRLIKSISGTAEEKHFKIFKKFFKKNKAPGAKRAVEQVLERMESNIAWRERDRKDIAKFLNSIQ